VGGGGESGSSGATNIFGRPYESPNWGVVGAEGLSSFGKGLASTPTPRFDQPSLNFPDYQVPESGERPGLIRTSDEGINLEEVLRRLLGGG